MSDDQRFASRRPDVLTYSTEILNEDMTLTGPIIADLMVSISTTDADFVVKIIDVFPDTFTYALENKYPMGGYQMLVRGEIMRGKFRNSFEKPEAFTPNTATEVKFELPDIAHTFQKGHKLMIQIQST
jgi:predicted acyl esterase